MLPPLAERWCVKRVLRFVDLRHTQIFQLLFQVGNSAVSMTNGAI